MLHLTDFIGERMLRVREARKKGVCKVCKQKTEEKTVTVTSGGGIRVVGGRIETIPTASSHIDCHPWEGTQLEDVDISSLPPDSAAAIVARIRALGAKGELPHPSGVSSGSSGKSSSSSSSSKNGRKEVWLRLHGQVAEFAQAVKAPGTLLWDLFGVTRDEMETERGSTKLGVRHGILREWLKKTYRSKEEPYVRKILTEGYGTLVETASRDLYYATHVMMSSPPAAKAFWAAFWAREGNSQDAKILKMKADVARAKEKAKAEAKAKAKASGKTSLPSAARAREGKLRAKALNDTTSPWCERDVMEAARMGIVLSAEQLNGVPSSVRADYFDLVYSVGAFTTGGVKDALTVGQQKYGMPRKAGTPASLPSSSSGAPPPGGEEPAESGPAGRLAALVMKTGQATYDPSRSNGLNSGKATRIYAVTRNEGQAQQFRRGTSFMQEVNKTRVANAEAKALSRTRIRSKKKTTRAPSLSSSSSSAMSVPRMSASASRKSRLKAAAAAAKKSASQKRPRSQPSGNVVVKPEKKDDAEAKRARKRQRALANLSNATGPESAEAHLEITRKRQEQLDRARQDLYSGWAQFQ